MKNLFVLALLIFSVTTFACSDILNSTLRVLDSDDEKNLCEYSGNVVLVVNVASRCGYTPQYAALQRIYTKYKDEGFMVIGIPSRDFKVTILSLICMYNLSVLLQSYSRNSNVPISQLVLIPFIS